MRARVIVALQYLLPRYLLTALVHRVARIRLTVVKDLLIRAFVRLYGVDLAEVGREVPRDFQNFNDFFTRELAAGARPVDERTHAIVSPVDGTLSIAAGIDSGSIIQAKGIDYSLEDLFVTDLDVLHEYANGSFATIYLAPYNYHRVHMPLDGCLQAAHYVPGDLFSVNAASARLLPGLFRRNERLLLKFGTAQGPMTVVLVGALNVGSITTPWTGEIRPRRRGVVEALELGPERRDLKKGDLLGWFNMGSTVILLLPDQAVAWREGLIPGTFLRMGEIIGETRRRQA